MNIAAAVVTTFPDNCFDVYGKRMLQAFTQFWPAEIPLMICLDDDLLLPNVKKWGRPQDGIAIGWGPEHAEFVERNKGKDDAQDYRQQPVRFCHKVFAIARAYNATLMQKKSGEVAPRFLIWMDADVITSRKVSLDEILPCLPKPGDAVATLQRKDWPHSECGWMAFDLENKGGDIILELFKAYVSDDIMKQEQKHDSWMFDIIVKNLGISVTNLCPEAPGLDVWPLSPMGKWSRHYKGPLAKQELMSLPKMPIVNAGNISIQTVNSIPHEEIQAHIRENQKLIKNWIRPCKGNEESIAIVSGGPMLIAEDLRRETAKIVAVKHAIEPLKMAGIKPWACILLDPRPHVNDFVQDPDPEIIWLVASQVEPTVTMRLLAAGCRVWGYHASVNAGEGELIRQQSYAIVGGGSATATRGIFVLNHLGFKKFRLYGYDLCLPDKPDFSARDERGQQKYIDISIAFTDRHLTRKRHFYTEPQYIAQYEEMNDIIRAGKFELEAFGDGIVPFLVNSKKASDLRNKEIAAKMLTGKPPHYEDLLSCRTSRIPSPRWLRSSLRKRNKGSRY